MKMVFVVICNEEETEFEDPKSAEEFAFSTGLGFPDVVIIDTETDDVEWMERFTK